MAACDLQAGLSASPWPRMRSVTNVTCSSRLAHGHRGVQLPPCLRIWPLFYGASSPYTSFAPTPRQHLRSPRGVLMRSQIRQLLSRRRLVSRCGRASLAVASSDWATALPSWCASVSWSRCPRVRRTVRQPQVQAAVQPSAVAEVRTRCWVMWSSLLVVGG